MTNKTLDSTATMVESLNDLAQLVDYSFVDTLNCDPDSKDDGSDYNPRQVFSGHYVTVNPTPIMTPEYVMHSKELFRELGFSDTLATSLDFVSMFSGDLSNVPKPMKRLGWSCGYALSIYGNEYYEQCPFGTGNGYGDGRAISVLEAVIKDKRWEMQLKGAGKTPYCRGADGRAVLRSSIREFLAQEYMNALGVPTSRSLSLYVSQTERVYRAWYSDGSQSINPDVMVSEPVAISTRVAPSFIRVGQLELFGRRARRNEHPQALQELESIVLHVIAREYSGVISEDLSTIDKVLALATQFRDRFTSLVANWLRVGYCQGNFNSDNCAVGGFTIDYGPFGFCDEYNRDYQSWTGGGEHFSFMNQPLAAEKNFYSFCTAISPLLVNDKDSMTKLNEILNGFSSLMQTKIENMWASKLGLNDFDTDLFIDLETLMVQTKVDYTIFFRELSSVPNDINALKKSFYDASTNDKYIKELDQKWADWLSKWQSLIFIACTTGKNAEQPLSRDELSNQMKLINPKYILREWFMKPAYDKASDRDYSLVIELQDVITNPYAEQSSAISGVYYRKKPKSFCNIGGVSQMSCSS